MKKSIVINVLTAVFVLFPHSAMSEEAGARAVTTPAQAVSTPAQAVSTPAQAVMTEAELKKNLGYFYGYSFGNMLKQGGGADADFESLTQGLRDSLSGNLPVLSPSEQEAVVTEIRARQAVITEQRQAEEAVEQQAAEAQSMSNLAAAETFLASNGAREGVVTTPSGLQYEVLTEVPGTNAVQTDRVSVHYRGTLIDGSVFDESNTTPAEFGLNQVIPGWTEGLQLMSAGDKFRFYLHPKLAYGAGSVGSIPPNSLLIFDVELLSIKK